MTTLLHERAEEYLRLRRALGFRLEHDGHRLSQFAGYLQQHGASVITAEHAIAWAQLPQAVTPWTWTQRLTAVRGFAAWLRTIDPATEIPPRGVFPGYGRRPAPFIFTDGDIARMHAACGSLRPWFRSATYTALFGLIAVTGVRVGEALAIPSGGIDLDAGLLAVRPAKSRCERILPLHPTTVAALAEYEELRARKHPKATTFFVSIRGTRLCHGPVLRAFREACAIAGIPGRPRIHDVRHSLAVNTQIGGVASDATFPGKRERPWPAVQRAALRCPRPAGPPHGRDDLGLHRPPRSDATMLRLMPLRPVHHRCACWHRDSSGSSRLHLLHHRRFQ